MHRKFHREADSRSFHVAVMVFFINIAWRSAHRLQQDEASSRALRFFLSLSTAAGFNAQKASHPPHDAESAEQRSHWLGWVARKQFIATLKELFAMFSIATSAQATGAKGQNT